MNNREAYEKWWANNGHFAGPKDAWQACAEHYEAVMRRAVVFAWMRSTGKGPQAEDVDGIIKRAREEG